MIECSEAGFNCYSALPGIINSFICVFSSNFQYISKSLQPPSPHIPRETEILRT